MKIWNNCTSIVTNWCNSLFVLNFHPLCYFPLVTISLLAPKSIWWCVYVDDGMVLFLTINVQSCNPVSRITLFTSLLRTQMDAYVTYKTFRMQYTLMVS